MRSFCLRSGGFWLLVCYFATCSPPCASPEMVFEVFYTLTPNKKVYYLQDTLWLEANSSVFLKDAKGGAIVDFSKAQNFGAEIGFIAINPDAKTRPSANSFDFVEKIGNITLPQGASESYQKTLRKTLFWENDRHYQLKIGIIPKEKGTFTIGLNYSPKVIRQNAGKCDAYARVNYRYKVANNNFDLYKIFSPQATDTQNFYSFIIE